MYGLRVLPAEATLDFELWWKGGRGTRSNLQYECKGRVDKDRGAGTRGGAAG